MQTQLDVPTVRLTRKAWETITTEALTHSSETETGGMLLGRREGLRLALVEVAGGPGPRAVHQPASFHRDLEHAQALADAAWNDHRAEWIGEWHTHLGANLAPSELDLSSYLRHLKDPDLGFEVFISLIVGLANTRVAAAGWMTTRSELTLARVELAGATDDAASDRQTATDVSADRSFNPPTASLS